jgi:hypothetical protein
MQDNTNKIIANVHTSIGIPSQGPGFERAKIFRALDCIAAVTGRCCHINNLMNLLGTAQNII